MKLQVLFTPFIGLVLAIALLAACATPAAPPTTTPMPPTATQVPATATPKPATSTPVPPTSMPAFRMLFVGNSFSNGLGRNIEKLADQANPPLVIEADSVLASGAPLRTMWAYANTHSSIREGDYDVVVLQEDIPETDVDTFHEYARKFVAEIREAGAEPVLFMQWPYERLGWITMEEIAQAHRDIAKELGVDVAPVGLAWQRAMKERPELDMYVADREHPSIYGSYLAVNVVYATIFGESPAGLAYQPRGISDDEAAFLQRIAWETVQDFRAQQ